MMRDHVSNDWRGFHPWTNVLWLHHLTGKLIGHVKAIQTSNANFGNGAKVTLVHQMRYRTNNSSNHLRSLSELRGLKLKMLGFASAAEFVNKEGCEEEFGCE